MPGRGLQIGVDTGGTFTDLVAADGRVTKVLSTPDDPARAVRDAIAGQGRPALLAHGTTIATNALLERRGATVALVTTEGLADVIEIGRQDRPSLYDQLASRPEPLVPRHSPGPRTMSAIAYDTQRNRRPVWRDHELGWAELGL